MATIEMLDGADTRMRHERNALRIPANTCSWPHDYGQKGAGTPRALPGHNPQPEVKL
jgi:hypothetical protein